jgi:hypothetical protein
MNARNPTQKTELESEHGQARNGPNSTKQGTADCLLQHLGQSATVPQTVCYSTLGLSVVQKIETELAETDSAGEK